jgi:ADP-ribose pyrophosphatase
LGRLKKLDTIDTKTLHRNPCWEYRLDSYALPGGGAGEYYYLHSPGSAMVVPVDENGTLVLVNQFRYLWKRESMEFPGGGMKEADPFVAAMNELAEEAGLAASDWKFVAEYNPFNGATDEIARVYFASGLTAAKKDKDASEEFEIVKMSVPEFEAAVGSGEIWDGMTLAAWMVARATVLDYISTLGE